MKHFFSFVSALILFICLSVSQVVATTFSVINENDSGNGSLRQAIIDANTNPGDDTITFDIPGSASSHTTTAEI